MALREPARFEHSAGRPPGGPRTPLIQRLAWWAQRSPDSPAFTFADHGTGEPDGPDGPDGLDGTEETLTWEAAYLRTGVLARSLRMAGAAGQRVAIMAPQGLDYTIGFLAALSARAVAVPLFAPRLPGHRETLRAVYADADPAVIVTTSGALADVEGFLAASGLPSPKEIICADLELEGRVDPPDPAIDPDDLAYLQYTSGTAHAPCGVMITHGNLTANATQLFDGFGARPSGSVIVSWLPLFHDLGLMTAAGLPLVYGNRSVLMDPVAFMTHPLRWLRLMSRYDDVYTAGPDFAYEHCATRISDEELAGLELCGLTICLNGAEPVRPGTLEAFQRRFGPAGLGPHALCPAYGLAEATVYVSAEHVEEPYLVTAFDRDALARGEARPASGPGAVARLVSYGTPYGAEVAIADPASRRLLPHGRVGEIWVHGPNVAAGYWNDPERSVRVFGAELAEHGVLPARPWLRTGDLGFLHEGRLYVLGHLQPLALPPE